MAEEVAIRGASSVTVARVIARARVSRRLFYELFADIEDCLLATLDWVLAQARAVAVEAYSAEQGWLEGIRAALAALLRFFDEQPLLAQLCIVHAAGGGLRVLERRSRAIAELCEVVDRGRRVGIACPARWLPRAWLGLCSRCSTPVCSNVGPDPRATTTNRSRGGRG
jgi:AcrR family transcriptional regulator